MKILVDMNLTPQWCPALREHGHQCVHWSEIGDPTADDSVLMEWARSHSHVVLTHDLDMGAILAVTQALGPSVIQIRRQDVMPSAMGELLAALLREYEAELTAGALIVVDEAKSRVRILPLHR